MISAYSQFLIHNASTVSSVESAIRSATYLLPGRFEGAEIASEGGQSTSHLISRSSRLLFRWSRVDWEDGLKG